MDAATKAHLRPVETKYGPGLHPAMPAEVYHALPVVSRSALWALKDCPARCRHYMLHGIDPTPAMAFGSLGHVLVLEPHRFDELFALRSEPCLTKGGAIASNPKNTNDWTAFLEANPDRTCLLVEEYEEAREFAAAVRAKPQVAKLLSRAGQSEVSAIGEVGGQICKARADWYTTTRSGKPVLVDLKTTTDASPEAFSRSMAQHGYAVQAGLYSLVFEAATGAEHPDFFFVAIERDAPYLAGVYRLDDESLAAGREEAHALLELFRQHMESGEWPDYSSRPMQIGLPRWYEPATRRGA